MLALCRPRRALVGILGELRLAPSRRGLGCLSSLTRSPSIPRLPSFSRTESTATKPAFESGSAGAPKPSPEEYVQPSIRTLRPDALSPEDHVVFPVDQEYCFVWDALAQEKPGSSPPTDKSRPFSTIRYSEDDTYFPAGLQGFFYYYNYAGGVPRTSGELRFRKTYSNDPVDFSSGQDLPAAHGLPWRIQLPTLAISPFHQSIRQILLRDNLVDEKTMKVAAEMGTARARRREQIPVIHSLRQPFFLDFASPIHWWHFMGPDRIHFTRPSSNVLAPRVGDKRLPSPWKGSAICAFVPSKRPIDKNRKLINILVISIVDPPTPNPAFPTEFRQVVDPTPPREGEIIRRGRLPWALDVDTCPEWRAVGFRTLFENAQLPPLRTHRLNGPQKS
ncbi:hypothetical protein BN946_scf184592.g10 [Trametes cinnabarina]|uniref:Uncharacterized protein n=1 Tax=Pycnoporus cinnabarinus TaxID=5643 RepID=A0A060SXY5_PYCCI|nr:hypothetical protein BN946_scf184592.g10 [Trametes cinnabarina]